MGSGVRCPMGRAVFEGLLSEQASQRQLLKVNFLRGIIALDRLRDDGTSGITFGEILRLGLYDPRHIAGCRYRGYSCQ